MTFSRTALVAIGIAMVAGGAFGYWRYGRAPLQAADVTQTITASAPDLIVGAWTSKEDASYVMTFSADGALAESYGSDQVSQGTYRFADSPAGYVMDEADVVTGGPHDYLLEDIDGEKYAYRVLVLSTDELQLSDLDRGNTLTFSR